MPKHQSPSWHDLAGHRAERVSEGERDHELPDSRTDEATRVSTPPPLPLNGKAPVPSPSPPPPPPKDEKYLEVAQDGSYRSNSPNSPQQNFSSLPHEARDETDFEERREMVDMDDSRSEIQSIMGQFDNGAGSGMDEIMSPRLEIASPKQDPGMHHPPRKSSLDFLLKAPLQSPDSSDQALQSPPPRASSLQLARVDTLGTIPPSPGPASSNASPALYKPTPPLPDPEPTLPFDFHRFLEQLRHKSADPVAKFLRSFLLEFGKKQWMVHEQVKIIGDFLDFIDKKMAMCDVWRTVSEAEFDNAHEGMEKLVMNRLYTQTFSPAIPPLEPIPPHKGRRRGTDQVAPGRRGQHQEDVRTRRGAGAKSAHLPMGQ